MPLKDKTKWLPYHMFNVKWGYPIKRPYVSFTIAPRGLGCENNLWQIMAWESFPGVEFDL